MSTKNKRVAIVTGGGSGIGFAIAEKFIADGIHTIVIGRDEKRLTGAKEKLGDLCYPVQCDLSNLKSLPGLIEDINKKFDDGLTNAGCASGYSIRGSRIKIRKEPAKPVLVGADKIMIYISAI